MSGALLVDKPAGLTSHDVVAAVRRELGEKTGHAGTLDPFATGLLIVLLGKATRLQRFLLPLPKTYLATARLGWRSSTGDPDGELTETGRVPERLELPTGEVEQRLPMTSAARVEGERLYKRAHRGERIETPLRTVTVHSAKLLSADGERASFEIRCSSGTYVRTVIETLEDAYCETLRRTAIGPFTVPDSEREELTIDELLTFLPEYELDAADAERVSHGRRIGAPGRATPGGGDEGAGPAADVPPPGSPPERAVRLTHRGRTLAVARELEGELKPEVVLT